MCLLSAYITVLFRDRSAYFIQTSKLYSNHRECKKLRNILILEYYHYSIDRITIHQLHNWWSHPTYSSDVHERFCCRNILFNVKYREIFFLPNLSWQYIYIVRDNTCGAAESFSRVQLSIMVLTHISFCTKSTTKTRKPKEYLSIFRIRQELWGGAWCPKGLVDKDSYEYLQIDFSNLTVITKVEVQGRFGNGQVSKAIFYISLFNERK